MDTLDICKILEIFKDELNYPIFALDNVGTIIWLNKEAKLKGMKNGVNIQIYIDKKSIINKILKSNKFFQIKEFDDKAMPSKNIVLSVFPIKNFHSKKISTIVLEKETGKEKETSKEVVINTELQTQVSIIENIPEGIAVIDSSMQMKYVNQQMELILDIDRENLSDYNSCQIFNELGFDQDLFRETIQNILTDKEKSLSFLVNVPSGNTYRFEFFRHQIEKDNPSIIIIVTDFTEDLQILKRKNLLSQHDSLENISSLFFHKLNNSLMVLLSEAELMYRTIPKFSRRSVDKIFSQLQDNILEVSNIMNDLEFFVRKPKQEDTTFNPLNIVQESLEVFSRSLKVDIKLQEKLSEKDYLIAGNAENFRHAFDAIVDNAIRSLSENDSIIVSAETIKTDSFLQKYYSDLIPGEYLKITVADTGCGISKEIKYKIFEPFYSNWLEPSKGFGLPMALSSLRNLGGTLDILSFEEIGTTATLFLPIKTSIIHEKASGSKREEKVLVIDDDDMARNVTVKMLEFLGYESFSASNGKEGLELFEFAMPNLVLLDMIIPGMSSVEIYSKLKKIDKTTKIIIITGYSQSTTEYEKLQKLDKITLLSKPFTLNDLSKIVEEVLIDK